ncbi:hypothetical protein ACRXVG_003733 [Acinetobacter baumannii]|uniref:hypothetical protein n=1 Tax=Acinetobacter baumannii TaxID=470 RepID=UPI0011292F19|nr:hypothetical protein [Acinetobacter baumannii]TPT70656.1 hypothetical protein FJU58_18770 [Acinetobacter baumannii]
MDNYKIKVKDEAESKEAQELFFELGYQWNGTGKQYFYVTSGQILAYSTGVLFQIGDESGQELTLPQLRDLVVLKRNDVKDANHTYIGGGMAYKTCEDICYLWARTGWEYKGIAHNLVPIKKHLETATGRFDENGEHHLTFSKGSEEKDPALISGADALRALADGKEVIGKAKDYESEWLDATHWTLTAFLEDMVYFKLKPQTIKVELEIPAPYKAKIGGRDDTSFVLNVGRHQYCYKTEEDYTKARDALEAVFDAAVRGTNS